MKYNFLIIKDSINKKIKLGGELCLLAFVICALSLMVYFAKKPDEPSLKYENEELVSVFKESDLYDFFDFDEIDKTEGGVYETSANNRFEQGKNE